MKRSTTQTGPDRTQDKSVMTKWEQRVHLHRLKREYLRKKAKEKAEEEGK